MSRFPPFYLENIARSSGIEAKCLVQLRLQRNVKFDCRGKLRIFEAPEGGGAGGGGEEIQCCSRKLRKVWDYIVSGGLKGQSKIEYFVWEREATITNYEKVNVQIVGVLLYSVSTFRI